MPKEEEEIRDLGQKLAQNPDSMVFVQLADAYRRSGDLERSVETCLKGLAHHPTYATARIILGRDYFDLGRWDEAAAEFRRVESVDPDNILVHRMLGQIARRQGRTAEAISRQQRVLALDPDDGAAQELLREALIRAKQPDAVPASPAPVPPPKAARAGQSEEALAKALKVADLYVKKKALGSAEEVLEEILASDPDCAPALERKRAIASGRQAASAVRAAEEAKRKADEDAKRKAAEAEAERLRAAEEAKRKADEDAKRKAAEAEAERLRAAEEAKRKADEDAKRKAAEAEAERLRAAGEAKREADEDAKRKAAEAKFSATDIMASISGAAEDLVDDEPAGAAPKPPAPGSPEDFKAALRGLAEAVDGSIGAGLVGLDGVAIDQIAVRAGFDVAAMGAEAAGILKGALRTSLNFGLGRTHEIVITTEKAVLLIMTVGEAWFAVLVLELDGNLGRGRLELRRRVRQFEQALA